MGFLKKVFLGYSAYPALFTLYLFIFNLMAALFLTFAIIAVHAHLKDVHKWLSHPIIIGLIGGSHIYLFYLFKTYSVGSVFFDLVLSGGILLCIVITGAIFTLGVKRHVLLK